ncbi:MAG: T9SS type A sorting domain-containing protein [Bacteroidales bacterium]|nr:T9SS type A sorting domain-containing protein [Bacteroidales bacterium]
MKKSLLIFVTLLISFTICGQQVSKDNIQRTEFVFSKYRTVNVSEIQGGWKFNLQTYQKVREGNEKYGKGLKNLKSEIEKKFPRKPIINSKIRNVVFDADTPVVLRNFSGNGFDYGIPNDNTVAISNDGYLLSAINSNIYMYDVDADSLIKDISLNAFADTLDTISAHQYDPKVLYDPSADRFIVVHLAGASSDTLTNIIVGFSQSNDPAGLWNMYKIPGDPLAADTNWTDFPAIAVTDNELFITGNLLHYGGSWQTSFDESVIWQIDKSTGYSGNNLFAELWHNIHYNGKPIRNIHPVPGGNNTFGPNMYFLSNRNFAVQNDTFFLAEITGPLQDPATTLNIQEVISDFTYGAPPNARQPFSAELQTNDARVLGAFYQDNKIQFVGNTVDTLNGHASIYHGIISDVSSNPAIHGNIFHDTLDYGYPNISYTGTTPGSDNAIISFNHSSPDVFPGSSAMFYEGNDHYSQRIKLKGSTALINILSGADRWGDYTGSQPKYNHPGRVWVSTSYGLRKEIGMMTRYIQATWITELSSQPDDSTTVIKPQQDISSLKAYPNPVSSDGKVFVEFKTQKMHWTRMQIYDMQGRKIKTLLKAYLEPGKHDVSFSTQNLKKGVYLFMVETDNQNVLTKKIIVR